MKGGGFYNTHSSPQRAAMEHCLPWLLDAINDLELSADQPVRLLDVGCSQGANSVAMLQQVIEKLRACGAPCIQPSLADLPSNDFNSVFEKLFPDGENCFGSSDVLPAVIGGSAYERLVPAKSLQIATTFNMLGWRREHPKGRIPNTVGAFLPTPYGPQDDSIDPALVDAVNAEAKPDLVYFLRARAAELIPGGKMLVQIFGSSDDGGSTAHGWLDALNDVIREMITEGILCQQAFDDFLFPCLWRKLDDLLEPLEQVEDLRTAFTIEKSASWEVPTDFTERFAETGDVQQWAEDYIGLLRAVTETTLADLFPIPQRTELMDDVYNRVKARFISDPVRYQFHFYSIAVLLTRN